MTYTPKNTKSINHTSDEVWNAIDQLRDNISSVKTEMATVGTKLDNLAAAVTNIVKFNQDSNKTPWGILISALGVLVVMITALGGAALAPLYLSDAYITTSIEKHHNEDGHPQVMIQQASANKDIERLDSRLIEVSNRILTLDDTLQREMRSLDDVQITRLDNLDNTLQREMRMLMDISNAKRDALAVRLDNAESQLNPSLRFTMEDYDRLLVPMAERIKGLLELQAKQAQRIAALEEEKFKQDRE